MFVDPPYHIRPLAQQRFFDSGEKPRGSVLCIHGFADSPYSMRLLSTAINVLGFRVLCLRLPGHGSRVEDLARTTMSDWQEAVHRAVGELHGYPEPVIILGRSFGGVLALLEIAEHPQAASAIITLATPRPTMNQRLLACILPVIGLVKKTVPKPWVRSEERVMRLEVGRYLSFPVSALREFTKTLRRLTPKRLQHVKVPVLILHGHNDTVVHPEAARYLLEHLGSVEKRMVILEGVGHTPEELHRHKELQQEISDFLGRHSLVA
ncbi:MAG: alpha/beta fold hydrolase [bacterium]